MFITRIVKLCLRRELSKEATESFHIHISLWGREGRREFIPPDTVPLSSSFFSAVIQLWEISLQFDALRLTFESLPRVLSASMEKASVIEFILSPSLFCIRGFTLISFIYPLLLDTPISLPFPSLHIFSTSSNGERVNPRYRSISLSLSIVGLLSLLSINRHLVSSVHIWAVFLFSSDSICGFSSLLFSSNFSLISSPD